MVQFGCCAYFMVWLIVLISSPETALAGEQQHLERTRQDLENVRSRIETTATDLELKRQAAEDLLRQLHLVEKRLKKAANKLSQTEAKIATLDGQIKAEEAEVRKGRQQIVMLDKQVRQRLIALYKGGDTQALKMLFSSQSPAELLENFTFFKLLVENDRDLLSAYRSLMAVNEKRLAHLAQLKSDQEKTFGRQYDEKKALQQARSDKSQLLKKIKSDQVALAALLGELEEKAARLSSLVNKLESEKPRAYTGATSSFKLQKGKLDWPVKGTIKTFFGKGVHAELGTRYDSHGVEFLVAGQQPIHSVWGGQVVFANAFRGYGNLLIVDHGGGYYSLYAQASRLLKNVGEPVSRGETIAYSGYDGNETMYFEIRQGGTPEDPTTWLRRRPS